MKTTVTAQIDRRQLSAEQERMAHALRESLMTRPRAIPPMFFYDALGSALFDAICELPWYNVARAELGLLDAHAPEIGHIALPSRIVELGPGNGRKARALVRGMGRRELAVHLVDISESALAVAQATVATVEGVRVTTLTATYEEGLAGLRERDAHHGSTLVAFLGSNIGNFDPACAQDFLGRARAAMAPGDWLLLGADLVKPERELLLAYDDPLGVTAAFNKNALEHINRELDGDFDPDNFVHLATWRPDLSRVDMHLVSVRPHAVAVDGARLTFALQAGERIWTESSYKYEPDGIVRLVESAGFREAAQWVDPIYRFALTLFRAA